MRKYLIVTIICCASVNLYAQQHYTLKSCLETGLEKNYSIRMVRNEEQISKNNATIANAGYLPPWTFRPVSVETSMILKRKQGQLVKRPKQLESLTRP